MSLILLNLQSNQLIKLENDNPLIIGRGNVEGCFDKRVSRSHGRITCTVDGKIRLEALHCNPCFFTRNGVPPIQQLNKNEEETLNEGDYIGLLPNAFWFKITSDKENRIKKEAEELNNSEHEIVIDKKDETDVLENVRNTSFTSQIKEEVIPKDDLHISGDIQNKFLTCGYGPLQDPLSSSDLTSVGSSKVVSSSSGSSSGNTSIEFERTRKLPLWMYEIDPPVESNKSPHKHVLPNCGGSSRKKQKVLTESDFKNEPVEDNKVKRENFEIKEETKILNIPSTSKIENADEEPNVIPESDTNLENSQTQRESGREGNKKEGYESDVNNKADNLVRPICQYEGNCYRKNPQHKLEYCHPGDSDYVPYEERPFCQFGAACYRKNERHKIEFRHPTPSSSTHNVSSGSSSSRGSIASSPLPVKRRRKKVKRENSDYEDEDEYDVEDPFINDASSDEYVPSCVDSEEEEDLDASREDD